MSNFDYDKVLKKFLLPMLRRKSLYWPARNEAKRMARIERGFYKCRSCEDKFSSKQVHVDHIKPVINVNTSFTNWDDYIRSLYCDVSNLQVLCINCHDSKSQIENEMRSMNKKKKKTKKVV